MSEINVTVLRGSGNWEVLYIDGRRRAEQHLDRLWPRRVLDILDGESIASTRIITDDDIREHVPDEQYVTDPDNESNIWEYPDRLPDELI